MATSRWICAFRDGCAREITPRHCVSARLHGVRPGLRGDRRPLPGLLAWHEVHRTALLRPTRHPVRARSRPAAPVGRSRRQTACLRARPRRGPLRGRTGAPVGASAEVWRPHRTRAPAGPLDDAGRRRPAGRRGGHRAGAVAPAAPLGAALQPGGLAGRRDRPSIGPAGRPVPCSSASGRRRPRSACPGRQRIDQLCRARSGSRGRRGSPSPGGGCCWSTDVLTTGATLECRGAGAPARRRGGGRRAGLRPRGRGELTRRRAHAQVNSCMTQPITIYTTRSCPYCHAAKDLLRRKGAAFSEIDVTGDPEGRGRDDGPRGRGTHHACRRSSSASSTWGGCDDLLRARCGRASRSAARRPDPMIRYALVCARAHEFEAWFRDSGALRRPEPGWPDRLPPLRFGRGPQGHDGAGGPSPDRRPARPREPEVATQARPDDAATPAPAGGTPLPGGAAAPGRAARLRSRRRPLPPDARPACASCT